MGNQKFESIPLFTAMHSIAVLAIIRSLIVLQALHLTLERKPLMQRKRKVYKTTKKTEGNEQGKKVVKPSQGTPEVI